MGPPVLILCVLAIEAFSSRGLTELFMLPDAASRTSTARSTTTPYAHAEQAGRIGA